MSLGWLTESSLMPKKSKQIKIDDNSSLIGLKAAMIKLKSGTQEGGQKRRKIYELHRQPTKNAGIEARNKKDEQSIATTASKIRQGTKVLIKKQKVYGELEHAKINIHQLLVDFTSKTKPNQNQEHYQQARDSFYSGQLQELQKQREEIQNQGTVQKDQRERLAWERQMLGEMNGEVQEQEKVQQVYDRRLTGEERQALGEVLKERGQDQKKMEQVRKRREEIQEQRIRKLKKLNILTQQKPQPTTDPKNEEDL